MTQSDLLLKCFKLLWDSGVCPKTGLAGWVKSLLYLHSKGWLYCGKDGDDIDMVAAMYRLPEITDETVDKYPTKEEGKILYIPFFASKSNDIKKAHKLFKEYLKDKEIDEVVFYERNSDDKIKRFKRIKEEQHV